MFLKKGLVLVYLLLVTACSTTTYESTKQFTDNPEAQTTFHNGARAGNQGDHEEALRNFKMVLIYEPDSPEVNLNIGLALINLGRASEAIDYFEEALQLKPNSAATLIELASALGKVNRVEEGLEAFSLATEIDTVYAREHATVKEGLNKQFDTYKPTAEMESPYEMAGFWIKPPAGELWAVLRESTPSKVIYQRATGRGGDHTVVAWVQFMSPNFDKTPSEWLQNLAQLRLKEFEASRYDNFKYERIDLQKYGTTCQQYSFEVNDRGVPYAPGKQFQGRGVYLICVHPSEMAIFELHFSQRYLKHYHPIPLDSELEPFWGELKMNPNINPKIAFDFVWRYINWIVEKEHPGLK